MHQSWCIGSAYAFMVFSFISHAVSHSFHSSLRLCINHFRHIDAYIYIYIDL